MMHLPDSHATGDVHGLGILLLLIVGHVAPTTFADNIVASPCGHGGWRVLIVGTQHEQRFIGGCLVEARLRILNFFTFQHGAPQNGMSFSSWYFFIATALS